MVTRKEITERLGNCELLAGLKYPDFKDLLEVWYNYLHSFDEKNFHRVFDRVEKKVKWHILPTLNDFYEEAEGWIKP